MSNSELECISKLCSLESAIIKREELKKQGKTLVFTNGCFDLLHAGHLFFLQKASEKGDNLWVAINSSKSVQKLKGPNRPIQSDFERIYALSCLSFVNLVITFETERLSKEIGLIKPDVYVKAGDYTIETLDQSERFALELAKTKICFLPFLNGYSTTDLIKKIKSKT